MVSLFRIRVDASQAKAELATLQAANMRTAAAMQMAWGGVNKMFLAGAAGIAAMGGAFAIAYLANKDFNKSMTHTMALSDMTRTEMKALSDQVLGLGIKYGESSNIIADGLVILAKAGLTQQEIMTAMPTLVQLMKANAVDFETAANIAMMTMNAFSLSYDQLAEVGDKAQKAFQATLMDIEDLQQGLQYAASTAAMAGIPFESLLAIMGTLADNAMVAGIASRSMNKMLLDIVMHTDQVQRWADSMGLGVQVIKDGKLNIDEIIPSFAKLGMSLETLIESSDIFTVRALRSWGILIGHADDYGNLLNQINNSAGELARTTDIQITSLSSMMTSMKEILLEPFKTEAFGGEMTTIMEGLTGTVRDLAPVLAGLVYDLVVGFKDALPGLVELMKGFVKTFQNILPLVIWFGKALSGINPNLLKLFLLFQLLKRTKIYEMVMTMAFSFKAAGIAAQQNALQISALNIQIAKISSTTPILSKQMERQGLVLKRNAMITQQTAAAHQALAGAAMGVGLGVFMAVTGMSREARVMGGAIAVVMSLAMAYQVLAAAKGAAQLWTVPARIAAGAAVIGGFSALAYAAMSDIPEPKMPKYDFSMPEVPTAQGGMRVVGGSGPQMVMAHPGEQISSANKEAGGGGAIIEIRDSMFVDWDTFVKRMREDIGVENIKEIRRYK